MMRSPFHGFAFWFDVELTGLAVLLLNNGMPPSFVEPSNSYSQEGNIHRKKRPNPNEALVLSTALEDPPTHWQQTLVYFYEPLDVKQGSRTLSQSKENARFMNIHLEYSSGGRSFVKESVMR
ncbi:probable protein arginine N-methyltransferase 6 [Lycium barbarum]|uniref:probable protein arginine N-methyltransferase 6 n=1 Tax=Lycium barbarum TaxID=112863 RepID=UPI00293F51B1|nr:probable protein arginine N-methyltransferase 6 [Lycium barbarum]XP_060186006.1 probable protein arginine N-methyltransferase 6 [Lycium barbarum]XP_060186007.1 probable protein arginine N-methyltransferase 6 [Lycium barbarum]XP_060186008.1 probable protein arginine N-methyltransferase 6 [Lycium barbarum]